LSLRVNQIASIRKTLAVSENRNDHDPAIGRRIHSDRRRPVSPRLTRHRRGAIDGRTTRHRGNAIRLLVIRRIEEAFGWAKTVAGLDRTRSRGTGRVAFKFTFTMAAYNLIRMPKLLATA
jgi:Transposase DDE domain